MTMRRAALTLLLAITTSLCGSCSDTPMGNQALDMGSQHWASAIPTLQANRPFEVMTWNLYLGGTVVPLLGATSVPDLMGKVSDLWASVQQTDFNERAEVIAKEIARKQPELVGLQEAVLWRIQSPGDFLAGNFTPNAETVAYDFLEVLLAALKAHGLRYEALIVVDAFDAEAPSASFDDIRLTDRDVILVRTDISSQDLVFTNLQGENFEAKITRDLLGMVPIVMPNSWLSVDVHGPGKSMRFVTTHLSFFSQQARVDQAVELLAGPLDTELPVVLVGDLNSDAAAADLAQDAPAYLLLRSAGFEDAWLGGGTGDGFTAHQDNDLRNAESKLTRRIDIVLHRDAFVALHADLTGDQQMDRTRSGMWPSDHAGVNATLKLATAGGH